MLGEGGAVGRRVIQEEGLVANAAVMGERLLRGLRDLQARYGLIEDVRGRGLIVATEFADAATAEAVQQAALQRNLLLLTCGTYNNVVRWTPPLVVQADQIDAALDIFEAALRAVAGA